MSIVIIRRLVPSTRRRLGPTAGSTRPFDDNSYIGYDPRLSSQLFDSLTATQFADSDSVKDSATDSPIFHDDNSNYFFSSGDDEFLSQPVPEIYA
jgi:hypothetical protein